MSERVLVVDDEAGIREGMRWALEDAGFAVETATDGIDGLSRLKTFSPHLVVLDITMPGLDGFGLVDAIRTAGVDTRLFVVTADGGAEQKARRVGAHGHMRKPFEMSRFVEAVRVALKG